MDDKQRLYKLQNGSDTAKWAYQEIQRLRAENEQLQKMLYRQAKNYSERLRGSNNEA